MIIQSKNSPRGLKPGKKKEKTSGSPWGACPILSTRFSTNETRRTSGAFSNSKDFISLVNLRSGSNSEPWAGSASRTTDRASRSRRSAATMAPMSPYRSFPNDIPVCTSLKTPVRNAVAIVSTYRGEGLEMPNRCANRTAKKGAVLGWYCSRDKPDRGEL